MPSLMSKLSEDFSLQPFLHHGKGCGEGKGTQILRNTLTGENSDKIQNSTCVDLVGSTIHLFTHSCNQVFVRCQRWAKYCILIRARNEMKTDAFPMALILQIREKDIIKCSNELIVTIVPKVIQESFSMMSMPMFSDFTQLGRTQNQSGRGAQEASVICLYKMHVLHLNHDIQYNIAYYYYLASLSA